MTTFVVSAIYFFKLNNEKVKLNMMPKLELVWHAEKYLPKCCFMKVIMLYITKQQLFSCPSKSIFCRISF